MIVTAVPEAVGKEVTVTARVGGAAIGTKPIKLVFADVPDFGPDEI